MEANFQIGDIVQVMPRCWYRPGQFGVVREILSGGQFGVDFDGVCADMLARELRPRLPVFPLAPPTPSKVTRYTVGATGSAVVVEFDSEHCAATVYAGQGGQPESLWAATLNEMIAQIAKFGPVISA